MDQGNPLLVMYNSVTSLLQWVYFLDESKVDKAVKHLDFG
jgi:hypothetical protein